MPNRIYNYSAFYVAEPFRDTNLGPNTARDFCFYNTLRMWKGRDPNFPFLDAHNTTYNVRDDSDWEMTLKPRLYERLRNSKNIILFLSSVTKNSRALYEEIDYGINSLGLPIIVIYPEFNSASEIYIPYVDFTQSVKSKWDNLPIFKNNMYKVPTIHIPLNKELVTRALCDVRFTFQHKTTNGCWHY